MWPHPTRQYALHPTNPRLPRHAPGVGASGGNTPALRFAGNPDTSDGSPEASKASQSAKESNPAKDSDQFVQGDTAKQSTAPKRPDTPEPASPTGSKAPNGPDTPKDAQESKQPESRKEDNHTNAAAESTDATAESPNASKEGKSEKHESPAGSAQSESKSDAGQSGAKQQPPKSSPEKSPEESPQKSKNAAPQKKAPQQEPPSGKTVAASEKSASSNSKTATPTGKTSAAIGKSAATGVKAGSVSAIAEQGGKSAQTIVQANRNAAAIRRQIQAQMFTNVVPLMSSLFWLGGPVPGVAVGVPIAYASGIAGRRMKKGLNGEEGKIKDVTVKIDELLRFISSTRTIQPGDISGKLTNILGTGAAADALKTTVEWMEKSRLINSRLFRWILPHVRQLRNLDQYGSAAASGSKIVRLFGKLGKGLMINVAVSKHSNPFKAAWAGTKAALKWIYALQLAGYEVGRTVLSRLIRR